MSEFDQEKFAKSMGDAISDALSRRTPTPLEKLRNALANVALSGLGTSVALIIGFWFNGVKNSSEESLKNAEEARQSGILLRRDLRADNQKMLDAVQEVRGLSARNEGTLNVLFDSTARLDAKFAELERQRGEKVTGPVLPPFLEPQHKSADPSSEQIQMSKELLRQREDKELYRLQQQRELAAPIDR